MAKRDYEKLITFIVPSRNPENVENFFDYLEKNTRDLSCLEVLLKFDDDDQKSIDFIKNEVKKRKFDIRYIITPRLEGQLTLWLSVEQLFFMSNPKSYFIQVNSDEPYILTKNWDDKLRNYVGFFEDDIFRLRVSAMKFANYYSNYDCAFKPESFAIYTRKWLELTEGTGDCWGSDAYQQTVAFHMGLGEGSYYNIYRAGGIWRDVPILDIEYEGLEFGVGVSEERMRFMHTRMIKEWKRLSSYAMQSHFSYLASRIRAAVNAFDLGVKEYSLVHDDRKKTVTVRDKNGFEHYHTSYFVPRLPVLRLISIITLINLIKGNWSARSWFKRVVKKVFRSLLSLWRCAVRFIKCIYSIVMKVIYAIGAILPLPKVIKLKIKSFIKALSLIIKGPFRILKKLFKVESKKRNRADIFIKTKLLVLSAYISKIILPFRFDPVPPGVGFLRYKFKKPKLAPGIKFPSLSDIKWARRELRERDKEMSKLSSKLFSNCCDE